MADLDLSGRVAFISGASRGIGAGLAERFLECGMRLVLCARGDSVIPSGEDVLARQLDVRDEAGLGELVSEAETRFGGIDLWVNNAGVLDPIEPTLNALQGGQDIGESVKNALMQNMRAEVARHRTYELR